MTANEIKISITLLNLVGSAGNNALGLPSAETQRSHYQTVINAINASGGAACRKLVPTFYEGNPADQAQLQQICQDIVASKPFFVLDAAAFGVFPQLAACFPSNGIPFMLGFTSAKLVQQYYPYYFAQQVVDIVYKNAVFALKQRGVFASSDFKKIGVFYRDCTPEFPAAYLGYLREAGVSESQIVPYNEGCPPGLAPPSSFQQAVLTWRQEGVTHATVVDARADFANLTRAAQQQGFRPKWILADDGMIQERYGTLAPDYDNIANAIMITGSRGGEANTPGYPPNTGTQKCNAIFAAAGQPPTYEQQAAFGGRACNQLWMLKAAVDHAPSLQKAALAAGLAAAGSFDSSHPWGPTDFSPNSFTGSKVTYAERFWRVVQFLPSCDCWQVIDRDWHPAFR